MPIIASLNGVTNAGWTEYAREMAEAGAKAIELNIYYIPADITETGREVEQRYIDVVKAVRASVKAPVSVKLSPFFSSMGEMALRLVDAGANGLVLFNRFYQPDFDLDELEVVPDMELSTASEIRLPLLWIAVLYGRIKASLAATSGVQSGIEVVKYVMAGADAVMTTSALAAQRRRTSDDADRWHEDLDGEARLPVGRADEGLDEPEEGGESGGLRARQLHQDPAELQEPVHRRSAPGRSTSIRSTRSRRCASSAAPKTWTTRLASAGGPSLGRGSREACRRGMMAHGSLSACPC